MTDLPKSVSDYMAKIGASGGSAGKGKKKTRSRAQYFEMARRSVAARKKKGAKK